MDWFLLIKKNVSVPSLPKISPKLFAPKKLYRSESHQNAITVDGCFMAVLFAISPD